MNPAVQALISAEVDLPDLKQLVRNPATTLAELRVDGVARTHLAMEMEDAFNICLPDDVVQGWDTVADVMAAMAARTGVVLGTVEGLTDEELMRSPQFHPGDIA